MCLWLRLESENTAKKDLHFFFFFPMNGSTLQKKYLLVVNNVVTLAKFWKKDLWTKKVDSQKCHFQTQQLYVGQHGEFVTSWTWCEICIRTFFILKQSSRFLLKWLEISPVKIPWTTVNVTTLKLNSLKGMFDHSGIIYSCLSKSAWLSNFLSSKPFQCKQLNNYIKMILILIYLHDFSTCLWLWDKILKLSLNS